MSDFEEFVDTLKDATKELVSEIETAWQELKEDLHETITVKYLRPGGVVYCKSQCKKYYGILTGTQIISLNKEGEPDYMDLQAFLDLHDAEKLKVATQKRIAVGGTAKGGRRRSDRRHPCPGGEREIFVPQPLAKKRTAGYNELIKG